MPPRLSTAIRLAALAGIAALMLVPTGMCICADGENESATGTHEPGCPKVRNLERPAAPELYSADLAAVVTLSLVDVPCPAGPAQQVPAVGHGPPRGQPLYLALQTLLI
jgi:hypothetical protein